MTRTSCLLCDFKAADQALMREQVWENDLWRLTTSHFGEVAGFSYLEPKRHVPDITALDGPEAQSLGLVLPYCCRGLKAATGAELVYVYVFGGSFEHLHLHLAPHRTGDALNDSMIKGEIVEQTLQTGGVVQASKDFPPLPAEVLRRIVVKVREEFAGRLPADP